MPRRKQSKPRQIKRSLGSQEEEDYPDDDPSQSEDEAVASDRDDSADCDSSSPRAHPHSEGPKTPGTPCQEEEDKSLKHCSEEEEEVEPYWDGPDELRLSSVGGVRRIIARQDLAPDTTWGPYSGQFKSGMEGEEQHGEGFDLALVSKKTDIWLKKLPVTSSHTAANCIKYSQGEELYCKVTKAIRMGDCLLTQLPGSKAMETHDVPVKENGHKPLYPEIQLLPQQAGMAAILATATVNKDIFPCKACGIWFRSERNLQAHLMYYCASRKQGSASPPPEGPSEHVCPVIHCNKSCPSSSALEIHMHRHSGERPFLCLLCPSAFTTKANCERHMKLHIATESGMCHGCGFVSGCRDTLYSHLVTCHMVCRSDLKDEGTSPPPSMPQQPLATGVSLECGVMLQCQVCGFAADSPTLLHKHVQTHLEVRSPAPSRVPPPLTALSR